MPIPHRHGPKAIARYKAFMDAVTANYPRPLVVDPSPLACETFAARFRDAVRGVSEFGQAPELYNAVTNWCTDYVVASLPGTGNLLIGPPEAIKEMLTKPRAVGSVIDAAIPTLETVTSPSERILSAIIVLMDAGLLEHATLTGVTEETIAPHLVGLSRPIEMLVDGSRITLI